MENIKNKEQREMGTRRRRRRRKREGNIAGICAVNILTYFSLVMIISYQDVGTS